MLTTPMAIFSTSAAMSRTNMPLSTVPCPPTPSAIIATTTASVTMRQHVGDDAAALGEEQVEHQQRERGADEHQLGQQRQQFGGGRHGRSHRHISKLR